MRDAPDFTADDSILGFKYQLRYALYLLFKAQRTSGFDVSIDVERIDDIDVRVAGQVTNLVQTKDTATVLTNSSAPLWKTLRIWVEAIRSRVVDIDHISAFELVTTSAGPADDQAIVTLLQKDDEASKLLALREMRKLAASKRNLQTLGSAYLAFHDLSAELQELLVSKIRITTNAYSFDALDDSIRQQIVQGPPGKQIPFSKVLFGRWDLLVETYLREGKTTSITWNQLQSLLWEISKEFQDDNLPTVFEDMLLDAFPSVADDHRTFVKQLVAIQANKSQIVRAQRVYLKATQLLGFWQRNVMVRPDEVIAHETRLVDECEIQHEAARTHPVFDSANPIEVGIRIYNWALTDAPHRETLRIRPQCCDPDVIRGCLHDLADRPQLGWHPGWRAMFS